MEYRGTVQVNRVDVAGHIADLGLSMATRDLRVSAFSQLRRNDEIESPSFSAYPSSNSKLVSSID
jgi:hypothetical protein